jgi:ribosome biogenesis GTPase A
LDEKGLSFLNSIKNKIAIISVAGIAKTGKSFLINNLLGIPHKEGFKVGIDFKPGTKGITMWDVPYNTTINGEEITVVFMDTEGLAAPGNPTDSYDPKVNKKPIHHV